MPQASSSNRKSASYKNLKIGVLYGGASSERKISLKSGRAVHKVLKNAGYSTLWLDPKNSAKFKSQLNHIDLAFIALHGKGGEDGSLQAFLEKKKIPYIGSDARSSRAAFDKVLSKEIFFKHGIPTADYTVVTLSDWQKKLPAFPKPFFVKPPREGSSIGAFAVEDFPETAEKLRKTLKRFGQLMVEKKIQGHEYTVGVLGKSALPVIELKPKREFYDFKAKYTKGMTEYVVPAKISKSLAAKLQKIALKTHRALGLRDFSRIDMMADEKGRIYVLEANSIPGFTEFSLLPKAAKAAGISFEELCLRLIAWASQRSGKAKSH